MRLLSVCSVCSVVFLAACSGPTDPSKNASEQFTGSVQPLQFGPVHTFTVANTGEITVAMNAMTPGNAFLAIEYGQPVSPTSCGPIQQGLVSNTNLNRTVLSGQIIIKGTYCVQVFDAINFVGAPLTVPQNYTITVSHP